MTPPLLTLRSINSHYGPLQVHFDLSLEVGVGEVVCLLGGNASGKSSAMKVILGLLSPTSGDLLWRGESIRGLDTRDRVALGIASVPEGRRIFAEMTVEENLLMGAYLRRDAAEVRRDLERMLQFFPRLRDRLSQRGGTLSGGEQQMLAMARALMSRPRLICMDEPTMGLSPRWVDRVLELIARINAGGVSVFMVEQNAQQALSIAHRGYVLQNGHLVLGGSSSTLLEDPRIRDAYLGGEQMAGI